MAAAALRYKSAELRFYADLVDFIPGGYRTVERTFDVSPSVKDLIEACGVPHPEIDLVLVNGNPVGWDHAVGDGEQISVFPRFRSFDVAALSPVHVRPLAQPRFVLDGHLGRLARHLRLLGVDAVLPAGADDPELATLSREQSRALLTRDIELLKRSVVRHGYFVRPTDPLLQCADVLRYFEIGADSLAPFTRCIACNGGLEAAPAASVVGEVPASVIARHERFERCRACRRVYWDGSHVVQLHETVATIGHLAGLGDVDVAVHR